MAEETGEPSLTFGWEDLTVAQLDKEARGLCPCSCHGHKTRHELEEESRDERNIERAERGSS